MNKTKGFTSIIVAVVITALVVGFGTYFATTAKYQQNDQLDIMLEREETETFPATTTQTESMQVQNINNQNQANNDTNMIAQQRACLDIATPQAGAVLSFPFTVQGEITQPCWFVFEGEMGFVTLEQNGQTLTFQGASTLPGLMRTTSSYYQASDYPVNFNATLPGIAGNYTPGPAEIVITERTNFREDGSIPPPAQVIRIPVFLQ